jgi:hypothetical protein
MRKRKYKMPLRWHEDNLKNGEASLVSYQEEAARLFQRMEWCRADNWKTAKAIETAKAQGLTEIALLD